MRVILLARFASSYPGSFVAMVRAVAAECERRGWEFEAVFDAAARDRAWYADLGQEMRVRTGPPGAGRGALAAFVRSLVDEREGDRAGPTILHTHFTGFDVAAALAARGRDDVRVIWHLHTRLDPGPRVALRNALKFRVVGRGVSRIVCVGPDIAAAATRRLAPADRLEVLANGIDVSRFTPPSDAERRAARDALDLPHDRPVLLHFGWDWAMKGGELFAATAEALRERGVDAAAVSVGAPAGAASNGVLTRPPTADVRSVYAASDVLVSASEAEGDPFSVLEALCVGLPVVASPRASGLAGGRAESLRVTERTPAAFADAIAATLARSPAQAEGESQAAREYVVSERGVAAWAERMSAVYERAVTPE
jgi:glycosyltransferase involved in cell wall biosynthesis